MDAIGPIGSDVIVSPIVNVFSSLLDELEAIDRLVVTLCHTSPKLIMAAILPAQRFETAVAERV